MTALSMHHKESFVELQPAHEVRAHVLVWTRTADGGVQLPVVITDTLLGHSRTGEQSRNRSEGGCTCRQLSSHLGGPPPRHSELEKGVVGSHFFLSPAFLLLLLCRGRRRREHLSVPTEHSKKRSVHSSSPLSPITSFPCPSPPHPAFTYPNI